MKTLYLQKIKILLVILLISPLLFFSNCKKENNTTLSNNCSGFAITSQKYSETTDLTQAAKNNLGSSYDIADWNDLKNINDIQSWIICMGISHDQTFLVTRNGNDFYSGNRHYYVHYSTDGLPYSGFLAHDKINNVLFLGSWYGLNMQVLGKK